LINRTPDIMYLNPYNTSSDSLYRTSGNPYLLPSQQNDFSIEYTYNKSGIYLNPHFVYTFITDNIEESGNMMHNVFVETFVNGEHYHEFDGNMTIRYRNNNWGNFGGTFGYKQFFFSQRDKGSFYTNLSLYLFYKNVWINGNVWYQKYYYTPITTSRTYIPDSEIKCGWNINNKITLTAGMRYFLGCLKSGNISESKGYYSNSIQKDMDRRFQCNIGFSYYLKSRNTKTQRNQRRLNKEEEGISLK